MAQKSCKGRYTAYPALLAPPPVLPMFNPHHTNEQTSNQPTRQKKHQSNGPIKKEPAAWADCSWVGFYNTVSQRKAAGYPISHPRPMPITIHRSEHQSQNDIKSSQEVASQPPTWKLQRYLQQCTCSTSLDTGSSKVTATWLVIG